jgi:exopolysaccharide biosynthesis operon protein EpsL
MRKHPIYLVRRLLIMTLGFAPFSTAYAVLDYSPYVYSRVLYDSNLFRLSGKDQAEALLGDDKKDDTIGYFGVGIKSDLKLSRQHFLLNADVASVKYDRFSDLDNTQVNGDARWAWQAGNLWKGNLGYKYDRHLSSFDEQHLPQKDMRTFQSSYLDGGYQITPDWELRSGVNYDDTSYDEQKYLDRTASTGRLEALYRNTLNTRIGTRIRYTSYNLNNTDILGQPLNDDYNETEISGVFYWEGTAKSSLEARLGYTMLRYNNSDLSDFNGTSGRLTYYWAVTAKTKLDIAVWRETSSLDAQIASYVLTQGASIAPVWSVTRKVSLRGIVSYANDDFKGENDVRNSLGLKKRTDKTWLYGVSANWAPRDYLLVSIGYRKENRNSTVNIDDYNDNQLDAEVKVTF